MKADKRHSTPQFQAWAGLLRTHTRLLDAVQKALADASLPPLEWYDVLLELDFAEGQRLRLFELGERIVLSKSNLTRLCDRLEKAGLVVREPAPEDRRGFYARLTPAGQELRRRMWPVYKEAVERHFAAHLSDTDAQALVALLQKLRPEGDKT